MPSAIAAPVAQLSAPPATAAGGAPAAGPADTRTQDRQAAAAQPQGDIVPEAEFDSSLPPLSGDINAPLEAMPPATPSAQANPSAAAPAPAPQTGATTGEAIPDAPLAEEPELAQPLPPI
ncbi:hypothetical protein MHZ35_15605, partial [Sphingomonas sp. ACRSK]|nr:hypothetical protein [Sphingomonas sp. ACRSK]